MMTNLLAERLKALSESAQQLPPEIQDKLAEQLAVALDNAIWDAQLRDSQHLAVLRELAEEARRGPKLPMPTPQDLGDEDIADWEDEDASVPNRRHGPWMKSHATDQYWKLFGTHREYEKLIRRS